MSCEHPQGIALRHIRVIAGGACTPGGGPLTHTACCQCLPANVLQAGTSRTAELAVEGTWHNACGASCKAEATEATAFCRAPLPGQGCSSLLSSQVYMQSLPCNSSSLSGHWHPTTSPACPSPSNSWWSCALGSIQRGDTSLPRNQ